MLDIVLNDENIWELKKENDFFFLYKWLKFQKQRKWMKYVLDGKLLNNRKDYNRL